MQCPLKKKDKDKKHDRHDATTKTEEDEFAVIAQIPTWERWGDVVL